MPTEHKEKVLGLGFGRQRLITTKKGHWCLESSTKRKALAALIPPQLNSTESGPLPEVACNSSANSLSRTTRTIPELQTLACGDEFDLVGILILAMEAVDVPGCAKGWEMEERDLYLADESTQMVCVRMSRYKLEPMPQFLLGLPIVLLNGKYNR